MTTVLLPGSRTKSTSLHEHCLLLVSTCSHGILLVQLRVTGTYIYTTIARHYESEHTVWLGLTANLASDTTERLRTCMQAAIGSYRNSSTLI